MFAADITNNPKPAIRAMRLYKDPSTTVSDDATAADSSANIEGEQKQESTPNMADSSEKNLRDIAGHADRTVVLSGIHSCCTEQFMCRTIMDAINEAHESTNRDGDNNDNVDDFMPERILD